MLGLAAGLAEEGRAVDLVLASASGPLLAGVPAAVSVVDLRAGRVLSAAPGLARYLRRERPHALVSGLNYANLIALWSRALSRVPLRLVICEHTTLSVAAAHAANCKDRLMPMMARRFYGRADVVIAVSQGVADDLIRTTGLPPERVRVVYNPIVSSELYARADEPLLDPWFTPDEPPVIVAVGRLTPAKSYPTLLRAFHRLRERVPCRLLILGEGPERQMLTALADDLQLGADCRLHGFAANPYAFMRRAAVFAMSSAWEGLPVALIEALALGVPIVSTDCPSGPREILAEGRWGQLVPPGDVDAFANALAEALQGPQAGDRAAAVQRFTRRACTLRYLEAIDG